MSDIKQKIKSKLRRGELGMVGLGVTDLQWVWLILTGELDGKLCIAVHGMYMYLCMYVFTVCSPVIYMNW